MVSYGSIHGYYRLFYINDLYAGSVYWTSLRNIYQQCLRLSYCIVDSKTATIARSPSFGPAPFLFYLCPEPNCEPVKFPPPQLVNPSLTLFYLLNPCLSVSAARNTSRSRLGTIHPASQNPKSQRPSRGITSEMRFAFYRHETQDRIEVAGTLPIPTDINSFHYHVSRQSILTLYRS